MQPRLQEWALDLQQHHQSSLTDGLRCMALAKLGLAWLPLALVRDDLQARRLVRAGDAGYDVPLHYLLLRRRGALAQQAERLWVFLGAWAAEPGLRMARPLLAAAA